MSTTSVPVTARAIFPSLKYDNAPRAIEFLCDVFGFEKYAVFPGAGRTNAHAQLKLGAKFIMAGATTTDAPPISTPRALGGALGGIFVLLETDADVDAHFERSRAAGATILSEPGSGSFGGRSYSVSDTEGYIWTFSSFRLA
jgi:uncharacterized glyoxalase superfamily protein PhnB